MLQWALVLAADAGVVQAPAAVGPALLPSGAAEPRTTDKTPPPARPTEEDAEAESPMRDTPPRPPEKRVRRASSRR